MKLWTAPELAEWDVENQTVLQKNIRLSHAGSHQIMNDSRNINPLLQENINAPEFAKWDVEHNTVLQEKHD